MKTLLIYLLHYFINKYYSSATEKGKTFKLLYMLKWFPKHPFNLTNIELARDGQKLTPIQN